MCLCAGNSRKMSLAGVKTEAKLKQVKIIWESDKIPSHSYDNYNEKRMEAKSIKVRK